MPIRVINVIPQTRSGETNFDSEPSIAVNPSDPQQIVVSAFTPDTAAPVTTGPYFFSTDGGQAWALNSVVPGGTTLFGTKDISVRFGGSSGVLYAGILRGDSNLRMNILRKANFSGPGLMTILIDRTNEDQPWVEAATQWNTDRVFVSNNDTSQRPTGRTASVDVSLNAATAPAPGGFTTTARLETRTSAALPVPPANPGDRQDGPSIRTATHRSGRIYGIYFGWRTFASPNVSDIVVVRDDDWASGAAQFQSLVEPPAPAGDGLAGFRVVRGVSIAALGTLLGTQRIGSNLSIAVDPRNARRVYIAWCDGLATTASPYTLRVRRSDDGGLNWTADLFTAASAINPGLAVNNQGVVALLYQQLVSVGGANRWRTHLVRSTNRFVTTASNNTLADVLDSNAGSTINVIIGDYANLIAVGKDFYGAFSAQNQPVNANFPSGITYLRNANFTTQQLLAVDNVTPVSTSVDPFFVHFQPVELRDDFYVRDWTDSPTSGDNGAEPSIKPDFYVTSDVWNRRGTLPGSFPNDQPEQEDAGNGAGTVGDNWLFARIRRRAAAPAGSPAVTVRAHFLISKLGTGSNYIDATDVDADVTITPGDPMLTFTAAEVGPKTTDPLYWHLNAISSTHLCAAVEISTPNDPYVGSSLRGRAPGWPDQDLEIVDDNNKAQRNMGLTTTPARGVGSSLATLYGLAHNAATFPRDMLISYRLSPELRQRAKRIEIDVLGQERIRARDSGTIVLEGMQPGENRWIGMHFRPPAGKKSEVLAVFFDEMVEGSAVNGFGLGVRLGSEREVLLHTLNRYLSVLTRLAAGWQLPNADKQIDSVTTALVTARKRRLPASALKRMEQLFQDRLILEDVREILGGEDPFGIEEKASQLRRPLRSRENLDRLVNFNSYLERIDAHLTMLQLAQGDPADILQNVRWQRDVLSLFDRETSPARKDLDELCSSFISAWDAHKAGARDYPALLESITPLLQRLAVELADQEMERRVNDLRGMYRDPETMQRLHRQVLLQMQSHIF